MRERDRGSGENIEGGRWYSICVYFEREREIRAEPHQRAGVEGNKTESIHTWKGGEGEGGRWGGGERKIITGKDESVMFSSFCSHTSSNIFFSP